MGWGEPATPAPPADVPDVVRIDDRVLVTCTWCPTPRQFAMVVGCDTWRGPFHEKGCPNWRAEPAASHEPSGRL